jgi:hypothetical protein
LNLNLNTISKLGKLFFSVYITCICYDAGVDHRLAHLIRCPPNWIPYISLILNLIFFTFLQIAVFWTLLTTSKSFVVPNMSHITWLKNTIFRYKSWSGLFLGKFFSCTVRHNIWIKCSFLFYHLTKRLVFIQYFWVESSILVTRQVFFPFIRINAVTNLIKICKGLRSFAVVETSRSFDKRREMVWAFGIQTVHIFEFWMFDCSISGMTSFESTIWSTCWCLRSELTIIFARIYVWVTRSICDKFGEGWFGWFTRVVSNTFDSATLTSFFAWGGTVTWYINKSFDLRYV